MIKKKRFSQTRKIQKDSCKKKRFLQIIKNKNKCVQINLDRRVDRGTCRYYQDNFKSVYFFYKKILNAQKRKSNQNQLTKQKQANKKQQRQHVFGRKKTSKTVDDFCFAFLCFFTLKIFS